MIHFRHPCLLRSLYAGCALHAPSSVKLRGGGGCCFTISLYILPFYLLCVPGSRRKTSANIAVALWLFYLSNISIAEILAHTDAKIYVPVQPVPMCTCKYRFKLFIRTYLGVIKDTAVDELTARRKHPCLQTLEAREDW